MENEFITYQQALKLKELGFEVPSFGVYINGNLNIVFSKYQLETIAQAPLKQQVFRWFREKGYYGEIFVDDDKTFGYYITNFVPLGRVSQPIKRGFISYEEAETNCIDKLIELFYGTEITE
jgi:hypothetical protein